MTSLATSGPSAPSWQAEARATLKLAWPLILAQIAQISFFTTDVVMMGWLGPQALAGISLGTALLHPLVVGGIGVVTATAPMVSQALGARDLRSVRRTVRQGMWVAILVSAVMLPILAFAPLWFALLDQPDAAAASAATYLQLAMWSVPASLLFMVLRLFITAKGNSGVVLAITVGAVCLNALLNYLLVFGNGGFPRLGIAGAGIATTIANFAMFGAALAYAITHPKYRRHHILVRFFKPDWPRFFAFFRIGFPIGMTTLSEVGLFGVAVFMMGWLGTAEVAAHAVAIQCAAISFMVPLGLSQATTIRIGRAYGAGNMAAVAVSGWTSLGLTMVFMSFTCALFLGAPHLLAGLFLDPAVPDNLPTIALASSFLVVAAMFQFVDGAQVSMAASLRGLSDTRVPMIVALIGYWIVGLATAYFCGFVLGWGGVGIWTGLASGLAFVAIILLIRWARRDRLGLTRPLVALP